MKKIARTLVAGAALALAAPLAVPAIAQIITTNVTFPKGSTGTTIGATIRGDQTRDFVVRARAGQVLKVTMSGSSIVYFNVLPPGSSGEAIFIGSNEGNSFAGTLSKSGAYTIRVYQMRATARRGESGGFTLKISVTGKGAGLVGGGGSKRGSIAGIRGMDAVNAIDELSARGFESVDSFSSGNTLYGIYYYRPARLCVQTTSANSRILDIRDIKTHPKCR